MSVRRPGGGRQGPALTHNRRALRRGHHGPPSWAATSCPSPQGSPPHCRVWEVSLRGDPAPAPSLRRPAPCLLLCPCPQLSPQGRGDWGPGAVPPGALFPAWGLGFCRFGAGDGVVPGASAQQVDQKGRRSEVLDAGHIGDDPTRCGARRAALKRLPPPRRPPRGWPIWGQQLRVSGPACWCLSGGGQLRLGHGRPLGAWVASSILMVTGLRTLLNCKCVVVTRWLLSFPGTCRPLHGMQTGKPAGGLTLPPGAGVWDFRASPPNPCRVPLNRTEVWVPRWPDGKCQLLFP